MTKDLGGEINPVGGGPEKLGWGYPWSPLVEGDLLIMRARRAQGVCSPALDKKRARSAGGARSRRRAVL